MVEILDPEQLVKDARRAYSDGDYREAAENFKAAQTGYLEMHEMVLAAEMANNCSVALLKANDAPAALLVLDGVEKIFERTENTRGQAITFGNRGAVLETLGRKLEASSDYAKAAELFKEIGDGELYASTMQSLSALQLRTGKPLDALQTMMFGIDQIEHPKLSHRVLRRLLNIPFKLLDR